MSILNKFFNRKAKNRRIKGSNKQNLTHAEVNHPYMIKKVDTEEKEMRDFLFTLGCFEKEKITVISKLAGNYIVHIKDARYCIDGDLAKAIII